MAHERDDAHPLDKPPPRRPAGSPRKYAETRLETAPAQAAATGGRRGCGRSAERGVTQTKHARPSAV
jgi:hypothetical protein